MNAKGSVWPNVRVQKPGKQSRELYTHSAGSSAQVFTTECSWKQSRVVNPRNHLRFAGFLDECIWKVKKPCLEPFFFFFFRRRAANTTDLKSHVEMDGEWGRKIGKVLLSLRKGQEIVLSSELEILYNWRMDNSLSKCWTWRHIGTICA